MRVIIINFIINTIVVKGTFVQPSVNQKNLREERNNHSGLCRGDPIKLKYCVTLYESKN